MSIKSRLDKITLWRAIIESIRITVGLRGYATDFFHPHLGGYRLGGDRCTDYTPLLKEFYERFSCRSALDVGCAEGIMVYNMLKIGYDAWGIEGLTKAILKSPCPERIVIQDLTRRPYFFGHRFDLILCSEVVEHIQERYVGNVILALTGNCGKFLVMTASSEKGGYHHVNCQPQEYWIQLVEAGGLIYDCELTESMRFFVANNCNGHVHFIKNGLIFKRTTE